MVTKDVVLVVGAGASKPYDFPDGATLTKEIIGGCRDGNSDLAITTRLCVPDCPNTQEFGRSLEESMRYSIDAFLQPKQQAHYRDVGRAAIAYVLMRAERKVCEKLKTIDSSEDWMRLLFNRLLDDVRRPADLLTNRVKVVTFNFDYLLEHRWRNCLRANFVLAEDELSRLAQDSLPIIHINGSLMPTTLTRGFGDPFGQEHVQALFKNINFFHDEAVSDVSGSDISRWMSETATIAFLGFGFNETNVSKLGLMDVLRTRERLGKAQAALYASGVGLMPGERAIAEKLVRGDVRVALKFAEGDEDCSKTLRRFGVLH